MTYDQAIERALEKAGDTYAVIGCRNIGDAASHVFIYDGDGESGTPWQSATLAEAEEWAMEGMCGVVVVKGYFDNDTEKWDASISVIKAGDGDEENDMDDTDEGDEDEGEDNEDGEGDDSAEEDEDEDERN